MAILTVPVLLFQLVILGTILLGAKMGKGWLFVATAGWTAFTLFGSIFTMGLLLLQLLTIGVAYKLGTKVLQKPTITYE